MNLLSLIFAATSSAAIPTGTPTDTLILPENLFSLDAGDKFELIENGHHFNLIVQSQNRYIRLSKIEFQDPVTELTSWFVQDDEGQVSTNLSTSGVPRSGWNRGGGRWELIPSSTKGAPVVPYATIAKCSPLFLKDAMPVGAVNRIEVTQNGDLIWQDNTLINAKPCDAIDLRSTEFTQTLIIDSISMFSPGKYLWGGHIKGRKFAETGFWMSVNQQCHDANSSKPCWEIKIRNNGPLPEMNQLWMSQKSNHQGGVHPVRSFWHNRHDALNNRPIAITSYEDIDLTNTE